MFYIMVYGMFIVEFMVFFIVITKYYILRYYNYNF